MSLPSIDQAELHLTTVLSEKCLRKFTLDSQWMHFIEEMSELCLAIARRERGRATDDEILEEIVDVFMFAVQMGLVHYGEEKFNEVLARKNIKFETRCGE
jgi:hypothetical protein